MGSSLAKPARAANKRLRAFGALILVALLLVLTACGAVINTTMTVQADGSGQRLMTLELSAEDAEKIIGGTAALEASIKKNLPEQLQFSGIEAGADGASKATFTLSFADTSEYQSKVVALLGSDSSFANPEFQISDSLLKTGVVLNEDFTSRDLLGWLFEGLQEDGVVGSDVSVSDMSELGTTTFVFGAESVPQSSGRYRVSILEDNGFASVAMKTDITDVSSIKRIIRFEAGFGASEEQMSLYQQYLAAQTPNGARLSRDGRVWEMSFSGDPAAIERHTATALDNDQVTFEVINEASEYDPASLEVVVNQEASCAELCQADFPTILDEITVPDAFNPSTAIMELSEVTTQRFIFSPPFVRIDQTFKLGFFGGVELNAQFVVANEDVEAVGDGFTALLDPGAENGSIESNRDEQNTTFTVELKADDAAQFAEIYSLWGDGAFLSGAEPGFWLNQDYYLIDPALYNFIGTHQVTEPLSAKIELPFGAWASEGSTGVNPSGSIQITVASFAVSGIITAVILLLLVVALVIILVFYRKRIWARMQNAQSGAALPLGELAQHPEHSAAALALISAPPAPSSTSFGGSLLTVPFQEQQAPQVSLLEMPAAQQISPQSLGSVLYLQVETPSVTLSDSLIQFDLTRKNDDV